METHLIFIHIQCTSGKFERNIYANKYLPSVELLPHHDLDKETTKKCQSFILNLGHLLPIITMYLRMIRINFQMIELAIFLLLIALDKYWQSLIFVSSIFDIWPWLKCFAHFFSSFCRRFSSESVVRTIDCFDLINRYHNKYQQASFERIRMRISLRMLLRLSFIDTSKRLRWNHFNVFSFFGSSFIH